MRYRICLVLVTAVFLTASSRSYGQQARFDLTAAPALPAAAAGNASNAGLLKAATLQKPDSNLLQPKGMSSGMYRGKGMNSDARMLNTQSTQYKLGNNKATSTIYYDEAGKVKGHSTTISGK